jgi:hypothetical protein
MFARIRAAFAVVANYLMQNPGAASLVGGELVLFLAKVGVNVTVNQLAVIAAILVPLIAGLNVAARRAQLAQFVQADQVPPEK